MAREAIRMVVRSALLGVSVMPSLLAPRMGMRTLLKIVGDITNEDKVMNHALARSRGHPARQVLQRYLCCFALLSPVRYSP